MLKRPSPSDDDDEILRQQEEFFKQKAENKIKISATVITSTRKENPESGTSQPSTNKNVSDEEMEICFQQEISQADIQEQIANTFEAIPSDMKLQQITEKRSDSKNMTHLRFDSFGFPKAVRRDLDIKPTKGSIFAQHIKRLKKDTEPTTATSHMEIGEISLVVKEKQMDGSVKASSTKENVSRKVGESGVHVTSRFKATTAQKSSILTKSDKKTIHEENVEKLNSMTEEEILAEREKLIASLDPALVQFLRSQRSKHKEEFENRNPTIEEQNEAAETVDLEDLQVPKEMLSAPEATGWLHFHKFEANKLAWMKDVSVPNLRETVGFEARFDFEGYLLPYSLAQIDEKNRHLYHHGDEPERPGYTLKELLLLSRSNVIQQRVIALNTLANVLSLDQTGIYDKVIDIPVEQVFFVIRVCLDDNTPSILNAAIKALRNLVFFQIDETCLDNMLSFGVGMIQPILAVDNIMEDDNTVNDQQLAETNLIKCLARTEIFVRIRYIINTVKPPLETIVYCIEILIRLARDSEFIINKILQCEGLLSSLIRHLVPPAITMRYDKENPGYNMPLPQMIKLLRVLSSRNRNIAHALLKKYDLLNTILSYLYEDYFSQNASGMRLQIECMYYWSLCIHYGLETELINQRESIILKFLDYHFKNTDNVLSTTLIRQSHVSALLMLVAKIVEKGHNIFPYVMSDCFGKLINQFRNFEEFKCGHSQITSAVLYYATMYNKHFDSVYSSEFLESILASSAFNVATNSILNGSLLLNNYETHKTTENLKSLEAAAWFTMDHIVPVMQSNSCIPFLYTMSGCILSDRSSKLKTKFLNHPNIKEYTEQLQSAKYYFNIGNWFTRCESFLIMNILKIAERVRDEINPTLYYDVAVKALCVFSAEQKQDMEFLLKNIVFCPRFYPVEIAMENARVNERNDELDQAWKSLDEIKKVYADVLGITSNRVTFDQTLCLDMSIGNVIPVDWIYTPLVLLYSNQQTRSKDELVDESADFHIILNCLRWILIYETYFESLAESISPTEKYVRLGCLFLGSDNLFLHRELQGLLTRIYTFLMKNERKLNFQQEISGLTNFKDFFVQLLEQYQAVSYGNKVFGNILLFPLVKRHDVKYRKTLWSEYMGVVETFTVQKSEAWINVDDLIYPVDNDESLCMCYQKALVTKAIPRNSVLYEVAVINTRCFRERLEEQKREGTANGHHSPDVQYYSKRN